MNLLLDNSASKNNICDVITLIEKKANINTRIQKYSGATPLYSACLYGNYDIAKYLLENKANVNLGQYCLTPLHIASAVGNKKIVNLLLDYKANINIINSLSKVTPLIKSIQYKNIETSKLLIDKKADIRTNNYDALKLSKNSKYFEITDYIKITEETRKRFSPNGEATKIIKRDFVDYMMNKIPVEFTDIIRSYACSL